MFFIVHVTNVIDGEMTVSHCLTVIITFRFLRLIVLFSCFLFLVLWLQLPQCSTVVLLFQSDVNNLIKREFKSQICPYPMRAKLDYWIGITSEETFKLHSTLCCYYAT